MYQYIIPFAVYVLSIPLIKDSSFLILRTIALVVILLAFKKHYKFKPKFDLLSVFVGILIFLIWILLEGFYPQFGESSSFMPEDYLTLIFRIFTFIILAPIIEEFFVRNFFARILIQNKWEKVPLGKFTTMSFIITVAFFGLSHNRWLPGIISGILFNYLIWKKKSMDSVIVSHFVANLALAVFILYTGSWHFW